MAKKGKIKISKAKHSNHVITKLKKQGKLKNQRHKKRKVVNHQPSKVVNNVDSKVEHSDEESLQGSDMMDMLDEEDLDYLMETADKKKKSQSDVGEDSGEELEVDYESKSKTNTGLKGKKQLLPIKTKNGIIMRQEDVDEDEHDVSASEESGEEELEDTMENAASSEDEDIRDTKRKRVSCDDNNQMSATEVVIARHQEIQSKKLKIGVLCSGIIECPEKKIENFFGLLSFMDEKAKNGKENLLTVRKLATVSILEVFKDILPDYQITQQEFGATKLKKETLLLRKYETALLTHYKKYLQKLEKMASALVKRKGDTRKADSSKVKLAIMAVTCLCDLLISHMYFNFSSNIAQMLVMYLNNRNPTARMIVTNCFKTVFKSDKKGIVSLLIVRKINHLVKNCSGDVNCEVLTCLLSLRIKDINLDDEKLAEMKQKKQMSHKQRLISMSKKEKKRNKKLKELEKEMLETKAEESKQTKQQTLSEIVKVVFTIYFRTLKKSPNSKLLSATLEGLSNFAHVMNLEFFSDLVNLLDKLLMDQDLGYREQLHCVDTVFTILSGQGEVLNIDPSRFYSHFYKNILKVNAGRNHQDLVIILKTITNVLIKRRKKLSNQVLLALLKRLSTLSTQVLHNGTLGLLGVIKTVMQQSRQSQSLLDLDNELGSGQYDPLMMEPEYCNASTTALYEVRLLSKHFHPTVRLLANHIARGVPVSGEGSLPADIGKLNPEQLFSTYCGSQMTFKPSIPVPKKVNPKLCKGRHIFTMPSFEDYCLSKANEKIKGPVIFCE